MTLLLASLLALFVGPIIVHLVRGGRFVIAALDGFVLMALVGLIGLHLLPHSIHLGGWWATGAAVVGLVLPTVAERAALKRGRVSTADTLLLVAALAGLAVHAFLDGAALIGAEELGHDHAHVDHGHGHDHEHGHEPAGFLALGVILHRVPLGMVLWWAVNPSEGRKAVWWVLGLIGVATAGGFWLGSHGLEHLPLEILAVFQALVAGSLLHVVFHHPPRVLVAEDGHGHHDHGHHDHGHHHHHDHHDHGPVHLDQAGVVHTHAHDHGHTRGDYGDHVHAHDHGVPDPGARWAGAIGTLAGLGLLYALTDLHPIVRAAAHELDAGATFMTLALESAPALLLAFVGAGLMQAFLSPAQTSWLGRGGRGVQAMKGMAFGLPLPICSCGVLPLYQGLMRAGVPTTAGVAFLLATPELGLDAFLLSLPLLGTELALLRLAAAALVAFGVAWLLGRWMGRRVRTEAVDGAGAPDRRPLSERLIAGLRFGLGELVDHTLPWILVGLTVAALIEPLMSDTWLVGLPFGVDVVVMALVGLPGYVCASGATPLVAVLLHKGLSPGAGIAFLLTGPATNLTTFGVLSGLHGRRAALGFALAVGLGAVLVGIGINVVLPDVSGMGLHEAAEDGFGWFHYGCLGVLGGLMAVSLFRCGPRGLVSQVVDAVHVH